MATLDDYPGRIRPCDRCGLKFKIEELQEQEELWVCEKCWNEPGYDELNV